MPRHWLKATAALAVGAILIGTTPAHAVEFVIKLPDYYTYDGHKLASNEFTRTDIWWGPCSDESGLERVENGMSIASSKTGGILRVPQRPGETKCIVAVVIGLDKYPMGRSNVVRVTLSSEPRAPVNLELRFGG